jgi:hypothetical protein
VHQERATLCLQQSIVSPPGLDDAQAFVLQYDADNVVPGSTTFEPVATSLPSHVARPGTPQVYALLLRLERCCPVWSSRPRPGLRISKAGSEAPECAFHTTCHGHRSLLIEPRHLRGFQVKRHYETHYRLHAPFHNFHATIEGSELPPYIQQQQAALYILEKQAHSIVRVDPAREHGDVDSNATTEDGNELPPYMMTGSKRRGEHIQATVVPKTKLCRTASTSAPSSPPSHKRPLFSGITIDDIPAREDEENSNSGTKIASSIKVSYSLNYALESQAQQAIVEAVRKALPSILQAVLPGVLQTAVSSVLPSALEAILPALLITSVSPSTSQSASSQASESRAPRALSVLGKMLTKRVRLEHEQSLKKIQEETLSHGEERLSETNTKLVEEYEELRLDLIRAFEKLVSELARVGDDTFDTLKEHCEQEEQEVEERISEKIIIVHDCLSGELDPAIEHHVGRLRKLHAILRQDAGLRTQ